MRKLLLAIYILCAVAAAAHAQGAADTQTSLRLRNDYRKVGAVVHVNVRAVKFAAEDVHPLYVARGEVIESFKGRLTRGRELEFYFHAEERIDVNRFLGERIVFLEGQYPAPAGRRGWYELENSGLTPSKTNVARMRRIKGAGGRGPRK
jgi:hypothetical protein